MIAYPPFHFRRLTMDGSRTLIMGVLNCTPDSFSDGGQHQDYAAAIAHGKQLIDAGADIIDIGGESTRPGMTPVSAAAECKRILPVVAALATHVTVSVDTCKAEVAAAALRVGAEIINDISGGLLDPELFKVVAAEKAAIILGHLRGEPAQMQENIEFADVVAEVREELSQRVEQAVLAGIERGRVMIDPGIGFGKETAHNLALLTRLAELAELGHPLVVGASRKRFLGELSGEPALRRELATAAAHTAAILRGASMVRVHDVLAQRAAVRVADALRSDG